MRLRLRKFDPVNETCLLNCFTILIGKRGSGKTTLLKDLLHRISDKVDVCIAVSPTDDTNAAMKQMLPEAMVHRELPDELLQSILMVQRKQWSRGHGKHLALVLDDIAFDKKLFDSKSFKELAYNGRHLKITVFVTLQYAIAIPPSIRCQADCVVTLGEKMLNNRKRLYENFFGTTTFPEFCCILDRTTNHNEALVLWNRSSNNNLEESLFWYKADLEVSKTARMSSSVYWLMNQYCSGPQKKTEHAPVTAGMPIDLVVQADENNVTRI
jgi:hypothetical protein